MASPPSLIVFCHLRWSFVFQRPQHILSRLAKHRPVYVVEEPIFEPDCHPHWTLSQPLPNLTVCQPHTPVDTPGFNDAQMPALRQLLAELMKKNSLDRVIAWTYTPLALPLVDSLNTVAVVYDCMDELTAFLHAPAELREREKALLKKADLVYTGGPSLYRAKKDLHPNVHCFSSSVDADHFGKARDPNIELDEQAALPRPRFGFFGVIDERFGRDIVDAMSQAHPEWQIVLVGPIVKIDPASLPRRENIHYFGHRSYADLPLFLAGWDVCLLPFARNDATRFISPTKTLEYMAAAKPIVSTPITDIAEPYGHIVRLGTTAEEFVAACEEALASGEEDRYRREEAMREVLAKTSWERTASRMNQLIEEAVEQNHRIEVATGATGQQRATPPVLIIGAGPTGLSAAYHLGEDALVLEREARVGGWCRSIEVNGFTFDYAGHIMFSNDPYVHELYEKLLGKNVHWQNREAWIYSKNVYTRYPFQGALYGLPSEVIKECIMGAIEARYGKANASNSGSSNGHANGHVSNGHSSNGHNGNGHGNGASNGKARVGPGINKNCGRLKAVEDCCADGLMESTAPLAPKEPSRGENFEEFIYRVWGCGIAKHFAVPYNRKLWAVPLREMETSWLGGRVPMPDLEEMIDGALQPVGKPMGPNARFGYPLRGGFQALMDGFLPHVSEQLRLNTSIKAVSPGRRTVTLADGSQLPYEKLISTMPLPLLVKSMGDEAPEQVRAAAAGLRYVSVRCVHLGIGRANLTEKHWIYYPEDTVFHRIFVQGNASPHCNPAGGFGLTCEITYSEYKPLPCQGEDLIQLCIKDCRRVGIFNESDPVLAGVEVDMPHAYVVYDHARASNVATVRDWLAKQDIILAGRYSEWEYYNSDHAFLAGKRAAEKARPAPPEAAPALAASAS